MKKTNYPDVENINLPDHYKQLFSDYHSRSRKPELVMQWSAEAIAGSPRHALFYRWFAAGVALYFLTIVIYLLGIDEELEFVIVIAVLLGTISGSAVAARETKVIYRYRVYKTHARLAYCLSIPKYTGTTLKSFAAFSSCCILAVVLISGSILALVGSGGIAIVAASRLLVTKSPKKREWSMPWDEYNSVTVDRKRRFVVTHTTDPTLGFEARLPNDELLEQYLAFLRSVLPPSAQFTEKKWNLSLI
ncbi:hypothetical protein TRP66_18215 [Pseudomonas sp. JDS28PS106]|uniref:hypothetical protein n=1 Tax=Pseudomonas sp. JDS28PS106 TaxID=2497235 RepID=UPI002FD3E697